MPPIVLPQLDHSDADVDDEFEHYYCCDPDRAYCGADISGDEDLPDGVRPENPCPMCEVLAGTNCPACGDERTIG